MTHLGLLEEAAYSSVSQLVATTLCGMRSVAAQGTCTHLN